MRINKTKMINRIVVTVCFTMLILVFTGCSKNSSDGKPLEVVGTGACEEILDELAKAFNTTNADYKVVVPASIGSGGGIDAVGSDEHVLGRVARPLKQKEADMGLSYLVFAKDGIVFAVGSDVDVKSLTKQQLIDIFAGKIDNWQQVGGKNAPIRVLAREEGDSSRLIIEEHIPGFSGLKYGDQAKVLYHDYEMIELLGKYPTAIGFLTASSLSQDICPIAIDGVEPTPENISSGRYVMVGTYAFVF
ncbi:MAG: substrate-binding domain-containing protein [Sedimentisphaerales bacterium]|nr:substrate-binding domain-containing protein [Sedimentisphaerales bacterium]